MNQRIKLLAEQAGGNPNYKAFRGHFLPPPPDYIDPATVDLEKFAKLIVKEMCDVFDKKAKPGTGFYEPHEPSELIKEHFGVEE